MVAKMFAPLFALFIITSHASSVDANDTTATQATFLGVRGNGSSNVPSTPTVAPELEMTSAAMEATLANLMLGKMDGQFGATPMGGSVKQIERILTRTMMPKVVGAHKADQAQLNRLANEVSKCGSTKNSALRKSYPSSKYYFRMSRSHKSCRNVEAVRYTSKTACLAKKRALYSVKVWRCKHFAALSRKYGTQKDNRAIMTKAGAEKVETYLVRVSNTVCGRHVHGTKGQLNRKGGWGGGLPNSMLDKYLHSKVACANAKKDIQCKEA